MKPKQHKSLIKRFWPFAILATIALVAGRYVWIISQADFSVDEDTISFSTVKQGDFSVSVRGTGVLAADNIQWLSANVDALVQDIHVKPGKTVKKGDVIIALSNPQLNQQLSETQWELEAMEAESRAQQVNQESTLLDQESLVLDAELNYESSKLRLTAQKTLLNKSEGSIPQIDFEKTQLETIQFKKRWDNQQKRFKKMVENLQVQNEARAARLKKMRKTLERIQLQVDDLTIKASMDSIIQELPLEIGQRVPMGSKLAKLAQKDSYLAELQIPEILIRDVVSGQNVIIDTRNSTIEGRVIRVDPIVVNGSVQVDVELTSELPDDVRPDMSITGRIKVTNIKNTLYVGRPIYAQSQSKSSAYRLDPNQPIAQRTAIEYGKGSVDEIQILSGLKVGDKIIISDPSKWESYESILIK